MPAKVELLNFWVRLSSFNFANKNVNVKFMKFQSNYKVPIKQ